MSITSTVSPFSSVTAMIRSFTLSRPSRAAGPPWTSDTTLMKPSSLVKVAPMPVSVWLMWMSKSSSAAGGE